MIFILKEKNGVSSCNETILVTSTRVGIIVLGKANIGYFNFPFGKMFTGFNHLFTLFSFPRHTISSDKYDFISSCFQQLFESLSRILADDQNLSYV